VDDGKSETYKTPECSDDGGEGQILTQGVAVKWKGELAEAGTWSDEAKASPGPKKQDDLIREKGPLLTPTPSVPDTVVSEASDAPRVKKSKRKHRRDIQDEKAESDGKEAKRLTPGFNPADPRTAVGQ
jgi:hypothetical protein